MPNSWPSATEIVANCVATPALVICQTLPVLVTAYTVPTQFTTHDTVFVIGVELNGVKKPSCELILYDVPLLLNAYKFWLWSAQSADVNDVVVNETAYAVSSVPVDNTIRLTADPN